MGDGQRSRKIGVRARFSSGGRAMERLERFYLRDLQRLSRNEGSHERETQTDSHRLVQSRCARQHREPRWTQRAPGCQEGGLKESRTWTARDYPGSRRTDLQECCANGTSCSGTLARAIRPAVYCAPLSSYDLSLGHGLRYT